MNPLEPVRVEDGRPMLLAGLRQTHTFAGAAEGIAAQWRAFHALGDIPHQRGTAHYGVLCGGDPETQVMEYMCAVEVAEFDPAAPHLGRMRVPPQRYAVFEHTGPPAAVQQTWLAIWNQALPRAGLALAHGPEFELYGERFDQAGVIEIWAAVQPTAS